MLSDGFLFDAHLVHSCPVFCAQVPMQFSFVPKLQEQSYCQPWLWIKPAVGFVYPSEYFVRHMVPSARCLNALHFEVYTYLENTSFTD